MNKKNKIFWWLMFSFLLLISACVSTDVNESSLIKFDNPEWLIKMPLEDNYYYGVGSNKDLSRAKEKAIIDLGQQFSIQVKSILTENGKENDNVIETIVTKIDEQVTNQVVYGAKFIDQYQDDNGLYWVLSKAPLTCMMDITEGILLSYRLDLKQDIKALDIIIDTISNTVEDKMFEKVPWTPQVPNGTININGKDEEWATIPIYYKGQVGDAKSNGTDLDYIKAAMDSDRAYFLLVCADSKWNPEVVLEINFDYVDGQMDLDPTQNDGMTDIHTNITRKTTSFFKGNPKTTQSYDPGVKKVFRGKILEFSVPLNSFRGTRFNILYTNIWLGDFDEPKDLNHVNYEDTWIRGGEISRLFPNKLKLTQRSEEFDVQSARFLFNGNANDISGNNNDGTVKGAKLTTDRFDNPKSAYYFNGTDSYISIPYSESLISNDVTVTAWIKTKTTDTFKTILSNQSEPSANTGGYCLRLRESGVAWFGLGAFSTEGHTNSNNVINNDNWKFISGVKKGTSLTIYIDGVKENIGNTPSQLNSKRDLSIGRANFFAEYFEGKIDDINIYPIALTDAQVMESYLYEKESSY